MKKMLGGNLMSVAVPMAPYEEMEANVAGSFLERAVWRSLLTKKD